MNETPSKLNDSSDSTLVKSDPNPESPTKELLNKTHISPDTCYIIYKDSYSLGKVDSIMLLKNLVDLKLPKSKDLNAEMSDFEKCLHLYNVVSGICADGLGFFCFFDDESEIPKTLPHTDIWLVVLDRKDSSKTKLGLGCDIGNGI